MIDEKHNRKKNRVVLKYTSWLVFCLKINLHAQQVWYLVKSFILWSNFGRFYRVSDPNYRKNVKSTRKSAELARLNALRSRPTTFPAPHDPAGKLKFALCKINHAEQCLEAAIGDADYIGCGRCKRETSDVGCREEASVCIAEALYVLSFQEAEVMLAQAKSTLPLETYTLVRDKYAELKKNACRWLYIDKHYEFAVEN